MKNNIWQIIYEYNNSGPNMDHCVTPKVTAANCEQVSCHLSNFPRVQEFYAYPSFWLLEGK